MQVTLCHTHFIKIQRIARCNMNVSTMADINSINTMNLMVALQLEANAIFVVNDGKEYEEMSTLLEQYMGKECVVSLFNKS